MFIGPLFTIAKVWKQPKCPLTDKWVKNMWCVYIIEYYSALKNKETLSFAIAWINLESIIPSEVSLTLTQTLAFNTI